MRPLPAVQALADTACDTDRRRCPFASEVEAVRVDELTGVPDIATQSNGVLRRLFPGAGPSI